MQMQEEPFLERCKQFWISKILVLIRALIKVKPFIKKALVVFVWPAKILFSLILFLAIPIYRVAFNIKKRLAVVYRPARNRAMLIVANRYTVHGFIVVLMVVVVVMNINTDVVRAEEFGRKSRMYELVVADKSEIVQEFAGDTSSVTFSEFSYREQTGISQSEIGREAVLGTQEVDVSALFGDVGDSQSLISTSRSGVQAYTVQSGDSLSSIASSFGLSINTLLWANNLSVRSILRPGDSLVILPVDGVEHTVKSGDTIAGIARTYDVEQSEILAYNDMDDSDILSIGDELIIPGGEVRASTRSTSSAISSLFTAPTVSSVPATGSGYLIWPSDLRVITQYFSWRHSGLDIDCHYDNYNYAADSGYVTFSGWSSGYGYRVDIDHGNGIVTRYGHHASLYVVPGQYVEAGTPLGLCGTTGTSTGTHLHLEVIVNGAKRNPLEYIR